MVSRTMAPLAHVFFVSFISIQVGRAAVRIQGEGLGKNKTGAPLAIRPRMKFDTHGVGFRAGEEFSDKWWERAFNKAASRVVIEPSDNGERTRIKRRSSVENVAEPEKNKRRRTLDNSFQKPNDEDVPDGLESNCDKKEVISDEMLFKLCGGLTAHKAARHGLKLSGKLARLEKHEKSMAANQKISGKDY